MLTLEEGARKVISSCAAIRQDERVLILYDQIRNAGPAWALRRAASLAGANAHVRYLADPDAPGDVFAQVIDELRDLDVVIAFTRHSVLNSPAAHLTVAGGARLYTMTGADERMLTHGAVEADFSALRPMCDFLATRLSEAKHAEIHTPGGTRLGMSLRGRTGVPNPPLRPRPGIFRAPYAGTVVAPDESSVEGTVVADASTTFGLVDSPVTMVVEKGRAIAVSGGSVANQVEDVLLSEHDDAAAAVVGVLGFGLNPAAVLHGTISQDTAVAGTGHLSLGPNLGIGGVNETRRYVELVYRQPTLVLDGVEVIRHGVLNIPGVDHQPAAPRTRSARRLTHL